MYAQSKASIFGLIISLKAKCSFSQNYRISEETKQGFFACTLLLFQEKNMSNKTFFTFHRSYFILAILLLFIEICIGLYVKDDFIRPYGGDFLVVILLYFLVKSFSNISVLSAALGVLLFSFTVEFAQYFEIVEFLHLQDNKLARIVIGTSYSTEDLVAYCLGIITVLLGEYLFRIQ